MNDPVSKNRRRIKVGETLRTLIPKYPSLDIMKLISIVKSSKGDQALSEIRIRGYLSPSKKSNSPSRPLRAISRELGMTRAAGGVVKTRDFSRNSNNEVHLKRREPKPLKALSLGEAIQEAQEEYQEEEELFMKEVAIEDWISISEFKERIKTKKAGSKREWKRSDILQKLSLKDNIKAQNEISRKDLIEDLFSSIVSLFCNDGENEFNLNSSVNLSFYLIENTVQRSWLL